MSVLLHLAMPRALPQRDSGVLKGVATAVAAVVVLAHASFALHFATVGHSWCEEHGHTLHGDAAEHGASASTSDDAGVRGDAATPDEHDACALDDALRQGDQVQAEAQHARPHDPGMASATSPRLAVVPRAGPALLLLAPKTSPPTA